MNIYKKKIKIIFFPIIFLYHEKNINNKAKLLKML